MLKKIQHIMKDACCEAALEELKETRSLAGWLKSHESLYRSVTICPKGLPPLPDSTFGGEDYEYIRKFSHLYNDIRSLFQ